METDITIEEEIRLLEKHLTDEGYPPLIRTTKPGYFADPYLHYFCK